MKPHDENDSTNEFKLEDDLMDDIEEFETTAVLKDHSVYSRTSDTAEMQGLSPSDDFLDDIDSPTLTGIFSKS